MRFKNFTVTIISGITVCLLALLQSCQLSDPCKPVIKQIEAGELDKARLQLDNIQADPANARHINKILFLQGIVELRSNHPHLAINKFVDSLNKNHEYLPQIESYLVEILMSSSSAMNKDELVSVSCHTPILIKKILRSSSLLLESYKNSWIVDAIEKCGRKEFIPDLYRIIRDGTDLEASRNSIKVLMKLDDNFTTKMGKTLSELSLYQVMEIGKIFDKIHDKKLIPVILSMVDNKNFRIRLHFNKSLASYEEQWILDGFAKMLKQANIEPVYIAKTCLLQMSQAFPRLDYSRVQKILWQILKDDKESADGIVINILFNIEPGFKEKYADFLGALSPGQKIKQLDYLVKLQEENMGELVHSLLNDKSREVRHKAILTMGLMQYHPGIKDLLKLLANPPTVETLYVVRSLGYMKNDKVFLPLCENLASISKKNVELIKTILYVLENYHGSEKFSYVRPFIKHRDPWVKIYALHALTHDELDDPVAIKTIGSLLKDINTLVREMAVLVLSEQRSSAITKYLVKAVSDRNPKVRRIAIAGLRAVHDNLDTGFLIPYAEDLSPEVRAETAKTLAHFDPQKNITIIRKLAIDPDEYVRLALAETLRNSTPLTNDLKTILVNLGVDPSDQVRKTVLSKLKYFYDPVIIKVMKKASNDDSQEIRLIAQTYLSQHNIR